MQKPDLKNPRNWIITGLVAFFVIFAIWLRVLPMLSMGHMDILSLVGSDDPLYNLRQVEQLLANHFTYTWFDPMTQYPVGSTVYWGPLFIYISGFACWVAGAVTRPEIIGVCLLVPVAMAGIVVILMYYVGRICGDWKTGLLASGFTAVVSGQFFYRSLYGYFDHHIGEVLFSTLFCLVYLYILISEKDAKIDLKNFVTWRKTALLAFLAGIAYMLGLLLMPTMIVFALMVVIFTIIQFIICVYRETSTEYLLLSNTIIFAVAIIGLLLFGFKNPSLDLATYSVGHVYAYLSVIVGTLVLYLLARHLKGKPKSYYPLSLAGLAILFALVLSIAEPQFFSQLISAAIQFFGQAPVTNTVEEARGWSVAAAWTTFNYGLILMFGGIAVILYSVIREDRPHEVFTLVWSAIIFYSTCQHIRYEYYLAVNVALLSAICVSFVFESGRQDIESLLGKARAEVHDEEDSEEPGKRKKQKKQQKKAVESASPRFYMIALIVVVAGLGVLFAYTSATYSYVNASGNPLVMNQDWKEALLWMGNNTPDPGVDYYTIYNPKTFTYPNDSYGVMSWWDYGHMITYIAKRIPNANPFQAGVSGPDGAAAFFMTTNESTADTILNHDGTKYVVTDIEMDTGKFWAMATWFNTTVASAPYQMTVLIPGQGASGGYQSALLNEGPYYQTMISRLHNFDGSMATPTDAYYVEYADQSVTQVPYPVLSNAAAMNVSAATARAAQYNMNPQAGYHAAVLSASVVSPTVDVPALQHYRLIYESPTSEYTTNTTDVKYVKIFEYVEGAHIKGSGIIDVPVVTNTGRNFTYRQQSVNGEFIVPYATSGSTYGVTATGKYQIEGGGMTFDVPESAVEQGLSIN